MYKEMRRGRNALPGRLRRFRVDGKFPLLDGNFAKLCRGNSGRELGDFATRYAPNLLRLGPWLSFAKHTPVALVPRYCRVSAESSLIRLDHDECVRGIQRAKPPTRVTFHVSVLFNGIRQTGMRRTVTTPGHKFIFGCYSASQRSGTRDGGR